MHAGEKPVPDHFEMTVAGETIIRFHYRLIKLKHLDYREFLGSPNPLAYALMAKMGLHPSRASTIESRFPPIDFSERRRSSSEKSSD